jgi:hypothetical protein
MFGRGEAGPDVKVGCPPAEGRFMQPDLAGARVVQILQQIRELDPGALGPEYHWEMLPRCHRDTTGQLAKPRAVSIPDP